MSDEKGTATFAASEGLYVLFGSCSRDAGMGTTIWKCRQLARRFKDDGADINIRAIGPDHYFDAAMCFRTRPEWTNLFLDVIELTQFRNLFVERGVEGQQSRVGSSSLGIIIVFPQELAQLVDIDRRLPEFKGAERLYIPRRERYADC